MKKDFNRKFMHPTRRKLVDMVHNGEYERAPQISLSNIKKPTKQHQVGERWFDEGGVEWEQRNGYKIKVNKLTEMMAKVRQDIYKSKQCKSTECDKGGKYGPTDKKLISKLGYCSNCIARLEHPIRLDGLYKQYEQFRIMNNMLKEGQQMLETLTQAHSEAKQEYEFVNADGKTTKWTVERPIDEVKADILKDIDHIKREMVFILRKREEAYEILKPKNYEMVEYSDSYYSLVEGIELDETDD
jgi:hypothetical protein